MPESICYLVGILIALWATALIAFPDFLTPQFKEKKLKFKARHWGSYELQGDSESEENEGSVEVGVPSRKIHNVTGSRTYAGGRGVSMRGG